MIWGDRGLASAPVSASTSRQWGEFLEGLIRRRAFKRHARNLHLHRIHNHHLDLQGVIHTVLPPALFANIKCRIKEGAKLSLTNPSRHLPHRNRLGVIFPCISPVRRRPPLNLLRNPSTRPPTTFKRHNRYTTTPAFRAVHSQLNTLPRDTCSWCPAHKHLIDPRTIGPLDDFLVHIHPYNHARKLSQRA